MSYFPDLTPHTYTPVEGKTVLNVGWLDCGFPFPTGSVPPEFAAALKDFCQKPIWLHRGYHVCQFCPPNGSLPPQRGNGQIRVIGEYGVWYAAPAMIHHYVVEHGYQPPAEFISAILRASAAVDRKE